jgi:Lon protease-like protein
MVDVALFPIPNLVSFPGVPRTLHVFEPRYRQMVRFCIEQESLLGVCQAASVVHANTKEQSREEILNSNQSTYKPCAVFSAGTVELLDTMEDGRMMITVHTSTRLRLGEEKQTLPFSVWACEAVPDEPIDSDSALAMKQAKEKILTRLLAITHNTPELQTQFSGDFWQSMPAHDFSFAIAGVVGMPADIAQRLLEMTRPQQRMETILDLLNTAF